MFFSVEESGQVHQALETKRSTNCQIWWLNEKSLVSIQDSHFVVSNKFQKERVKNRSTKATKKICLWLFLTYKDCQCLSGKRGCYFQDEPETKQTKKRIE